MLSINQGKDCEISIERAIRLLQVVKFHFPNPDIQLAVNLAILCMRKVERSE